MDLWSTSQFLPRLLAILIMDKKLLSQEFINKLDLLMANQLSKEKKTISLMEFWENNTSVLQRRVFWYYQARLRWMGNTNHSNTEYLLKTIEAKIVNEQPEV